MVHEQQIGGIQAFSIDHLHPRSKGGRVNDYANLYWTCNDLQREMDWLQPELAIAIPFIPASAPGDEPAGEG